MEDQNLKESVALDYTRLDGTVGFIKPLRDSLIIKSTGYATTLQLSRTEDRAVHFVKNEVVAIGPNTIANIGDHITFSNNTVGIESSDFNAKSISNVLSKIKANEPVEFMRNMNAKSVSTQALKDADKIKELNKIEKGKIYLGDDIVELVEYYYIRDFQLVSIISEPILDLDKLKQTLKFKYAEKPKSPAIHTL